MPSCLIELGFISTPDEERYLASKSGVDQLGRGIYQAFVDYRARYDKKISVPFKAEPRQEVSIPTVVPKAEPKEEPKAGLKKQSRKDAQQPPLEDTVKVETTADTVKVDPIPAPQSAPQASTMETAPVFKLQILTSSTRLKPKDARLKGHSDAAYYEEGGSFKYTLGASENYRDLVKLRKSLLTEFPQAFIIAFKDGQKVDVKEAIQQMKKK
jgi:N-acetylmuramoyl-L-alanine amidase